MSAFPQSSNVTCSTPDGDFTLCAAAGSSSSSDMQTAPYFDSGCFVMGPDGTRFSCNVAHVSSPEGTGTGTVDDCRDPEISLVMCIHGCGCTSSSWSSMMRSISSLARREPQSHTIFKGKLVLAAFDMRGHGQTDVQSVSSGSAASEFPQDNNIDLSIGTLSSDTIGVTMCLAKMVCVQANMDHHCNVNVILVGHSLGGAVAVRAVEHYIGKKEEYPLNVHIVGLVVVDVVEGTAIPSLKMLPELLKARPTRFSSEKEAIDWTLSSRMCNNLESAAISVPAMLREDGPSSFTWRTDIEKTQPFWHDWYQGLSQSLLKIPSSVGKMLVLASTDRLDKPLTIGHMQGKFQFEVVQSAGHSVHEDQPIDMSNLLLRFVGRITQGVRGLKLK